MQLRFIFEKPVDRPIEGVIKADDDTSLGLEVDEYILTNEIEKRLEEFLEAYTDYEGANGAWISGFFGSGKSHLLKMMSLLLGNREVDGRSVADAFAEKSKDNAMLKAAITKACKIPSKSILFNIDQKADVISKADVDALLAVFVKVFDESCGYYGKQAYIAQFERQLDEDDLHEPFKTAFAALEPKGWEWARSGRIHRFASQIDQAYEKATGQRVAGIIDRFRGDYKLSIEDFAEQIDRYIKRQEDNDFRLNFFVDEAGQYIAENTKLMTNLQTVAESLATKSRGRAWIIVTAQEDMNSVVGEMGKQQGNDFSKIQARFANRMKLTSQDVAEVIQKRLLAKTEEGRPALAKLYAKEANNFKTLFSFSDGSKQYRNFQHQEHFENCYPFVPYQFDLFQLAIQNLSTHNAFTGKHSSVGERSMLGVFQQVAIHIADHEVGEIATFDLMFEGIRAALKSQIQTSIHSAERNLTNPLAIRLLKALFLVKYVREFRPANMLNPTMHFHLGNFDVLPWPNTLQSSVVRPIVESLIQLSREDWNEREVSWEFAASPLLSEQGELEAAYNNRREESANRIAEVKRLETQNNEAFLVPNGLAEEFEATVSDELVTLDCNPLHRYGSDKSESELKAFLLADTMREFISYAVGCMFGRYSLDAPGLILANVGQSIEDYYRIVMEKKVESGEWEVESDPRNHSLLSTPHFPPDSDNVIPLLDGDWFTDDISERFKEFLKVTFGTEHYEENLTFLENALYPDNLTGKKRKTIRDYFLKDFYNHHIKLYKKRPIYWLFSSPKGTFNALIYMHRYRPDTVSVVLQYLRDFRDKLIHHSDHLQSIADSGTSSPSDKTKALKEITRLRKDIKDVEDYERDVLFPLAQQQIEIDLDDGVKVNYNKFGKALKKVTGLTGK